MSDRAYFESQVLPLLDNPRVAYLGHLSHVKIKQLLAQASVFVNTPLWEEPYGMIYAEALAAGVPVAAFDRGAAAEILNESCGVLVKESTVEALAVGIVEAAKCARADCRARAESFCSLDSMVDNYERLYRELVARASG